MVDCAAHCITNPRSKVEIDISKTEFPPTAIYGSTVKVVVYIKDKSTLYGGWINIDLHNLDLNPSCISSSGPIWLAQGDSTNIPFYITMPQNKDLRLRVSLIGIMSFPYVDWYCEDNLPITVRGIDPTSTHLACGGNNLCENKSGGGSDLDGCLYAGQSCGGISTICDETKNINLMGMCLPKPLVLVAGVLLGLSIMKSG